LKDIIVTLNLQVLDSGISIEPSSEQLEVAGHDVSSNRIIDSDLALPPVIISQSEDLTAASVGCSDFASVQFWKQQLL